MGSTREKGKIPHSEWPRILARYKGGETIASIGRAYKCTAPAIRYIVKRSGMLKAESGRPRKTQGTGLPRQVEDTALPPSMSSSRQTGKQILGEELRKRVSGDIASFLVALDQVVLEGSPRSLAILQEATDHLMRSDRKSTRLNS